MTTRLLAAGVLALVATLAAPRLSSAASITMNYSAVVTAVSDPTSQLPSPMSIGQIVSGSFTFPLGVPDEFPADPTFAQYGTNNVFFTSNIPGVVFDPAGGAAVGVQNGQFGEDSFVAMSPFVSPVFAHLYLILRDTTQSLLNSDAEFVPSLAGWDHTTLLIYGFDKGVVFQVDGQITELTPAPVPEPASLWLLATGVAVAARRLRRRISTTF